MRYADIEDISHTHATHVSEVKDERPSLPRDSQLEQRLSDDARPGTAVTVDRDDSCIRYRFVSAALQKLVYSRLYDFHRQRLHMRLAEYLEKRQHTKEQIDHTVLAYHWKRADQKLRCLPPLLGAAWIDILDVAQVL